MSSIIKAEPGYYVFTIKEMESDDDVVLTKHPVIAFEAIPWRSSGFYGTRPIMAVGYTPFENQTILTPDGMVYEKGAAPCTLETYLDSLKDKYGERLQLNPSV